MLNSQQLLILKLFHSMQKRVGFSIDMGVRSFDNVFCDFCTKNIIAHTPFIHIRHPIPNNATQIALHKNCYRELCNPANIYDADKEIGQ